MSLLGAMCKFKLMHKLKLLLLVTPKERAQVIVTMEEGTCVKTPQV